MSHIKVFEEFEGRSIYNIDRKNRFDVTNGNYNGWNVEYSSKFGKGRALLFDKNTTVNNLPELNADEMYLFGIVTTPSNMGVGKLFLKDIFDYFNINKLYLSSSGNHPVWNKIATKVGIHNDSTLYSIDRNQLFHTNEASIYSKPKRDKVQLLTTIEVDDIIKQVDDEVDDLFKGVITSFRDYFLRKGIPLSDDDKRDKVIWSQVSSKPSLKNSKSSIKDWIISYTDKDNSRMISDIIDIETFLNLETELKSIKEGDEVIALTTHSTSKVKNFPVIISFKVESVLNWLGLGASDSYCPQIDDDWGMIDIEWCPLVVTKETYNSFVSPDKRIE